MYKKIALLIPLLFIVLIGAYLYFHSPSTTPLQTFQFGGTLQKTEHTKYGMFALIMFDQPIGGVTGQEFAIEPLGFAIPLYIHSSGKTQVVEAANVETKLISLKGKRLTWTMLLQYNSSSDEYATTSQNAAKFFICNREFATRYTNVTLGQLLCNPYLNDVTL